MVKRFCRRILYRRIQGIVIGIRDKDLILNNVGNNRLIIIRKIKDVNCF